MGLLVVSRWLLTVFFAVKAFGWVGLGLLQREVSVYEMFNKSLVQTPLGLMIAQIPSLLPQ